MKGFKSLDRKIKKMDMYEIMLRKWPSLLNWIEKNHWALLVSAMVIFTIKPLKKFLS